MNVKPQKMIIVGAGLVGALLAIYLKRRGHDVQVYDKNEDLLATGYRAAKSSINMTLCDRGFLALDAIGVGDAVRRLTTPVYGRLIHDPNGKLTFQQYGANNQALYSVLRSDLNRQLLQFTREHYGIDVYFHEKCLGVDLPTNTITFQNLKSGNISYRTADRIIGADGAFSSVRLQLQKTDRFNYSQQYLEYGYRELTVPARKDGWISEKHVIHFWPRGNYMLMGFANINATFTFSLHMPLEGPLSFEAIRTREDLVELFEAAFPDVLADMPTLVDAYFANTTNSMITIRCAPWSFRDKVLLIGDSAHAIVPYYGQGANAGFEDCSVFDQCMEQYGDDWGAIFKEFERRRRPNTDAIAELAVQNFVELRDRVADTRFRLRKEIERRLHQRYPDHYTTLYSMIAFTSIPYAEALRVDQRQRALIDQIMDVAGIEELEGRELDSILDDVMQDARVERVMARA
jgi:kynurenine 3-monooxygenase